LRDPPQDWAIAKYFAFRDLEGIRRRPIFASIALTVQAAPTGVTIALGRTAGTSSLMRATPKEEEYTGCYRLW